MHLKLIQIGRALFFLLFLAMLTSALWAAREFSSLSQVRKGIENVRVDFEKIFGHFDNQPWQDGFGVMNREVFTVYRFKDSNLPFEEVELELQGFAFYIEGKHLGRKWKALLGFSEKGEVEGVKIISLQEPMGLRDVFYDEDNFLNFYRGKSEADLNQDETPYIQGAYLLSKSLDQEIRRSVDFFNKNKEIFYRRHPRQKIDIIEAPVEVKVEENIQGQVGDVYYAFAS